MTLRTAVTVNMLDMIGVGPFITLPLLLGAMGGPQAMLGWIFGAVLAVCDGLVWAELGAMMPAAGGSYRFLREMFPGEVGRFLAFLFVAVSSEAKRFPIDNNACRMESRSRSPHNQHAED
jgi:amino acid transporter